MKIDIGEQEMKSIKFNVEECDGYFVADAVDHAIVTQARDMAEAHKEHRRSSPPSP